VPRNRRPSSQSLIVLRAFAAQPGIWRYGYDITRETALRPGTLYPLLMRLAEQGILEAEWQASPHPGRPARHAYRLTSLGASLARETQDIGDAADPLGRGLAPT
jgi:DNA-binding PadR family transcriptional regulator